MAKYNRQDYGQLFRNSLVEYKGNLVLIHQISGDCQAIVGRNITTGVEVKGRFDFDQIKNPRILLGNINTPVGAAYVQRTTLKQFQIGLSYAQLSAKYVNTNYRQAAAWVQNFESDEFKRMLNNEYPDPHSAALIAEEFKMDVAFEREFSLSTNRKVYYRGAYTVGTYTDEGIVFREEYSFLKEVCNASS